MPITSRTRERILVIVAAIPAGRVTTYGAIARRLRTTPRLVARVLASFSPEESRTLPWFRVVAANGVVSTMRLGAVGLIILASTMITPALYARLGDSFFIAQAILCGILVVRATRIAEECPERQGLLLILGIALLLRLTLLSIPPLLSVDSLRYVWDGRIQGAGFNPYRYVPAAPELKALRDGIIFPNVDKADYAVTIYPPAAEMLFFLVTRIHESVAAMKIALVACEAITVAAVASATIG